MILKVFKMILKKDLNDTQNPENDSQNFRNDTQKLKLSIQQRRNEIINLFSNKKDITSLEIKESKNELRFL
ncbi:hypothetical protein [Mycoplasma procyoni]|uniref:hypothetical protein n=1 Tax=Mycoplasma procyoni TaxID=568784 RepID=UPI00197B5AB2|nr:hypothetical protein [Mycoplasma procyoni]MBN3534661.1 hypothetical protein [Mycoplasma procyoni]